MKSKLSYDCGSTSEALRGITIGDFFDETVARYPNHDAVVSTYQNRRFSYIELQGICNRFAQGLLDLGIKEGERVGLWSPNCWEWIVVQMATAKIGAVLVNLNPAYRASELKYALAQSGCSAVIVAPPFKTTHYTSILREVCPELDECAPAKLRSNDFPNLHSVIVFGEQTLQGAVHFDELLRNEPSPRLAQVQAQLDFDSPINIQYTSGTTGAPKGATLSHHGMINNAYIGGERMRLSAGDRYCIPIPFYHCAAMIMGTLASFVRGAAVIIPAPAFDPVKTLEAVQNERCTLLNGVPTMFIALLNFPELNQYDLSSLRSGFVGGSPCPVEVNRQIMAKLHIPDLTIVYGMTELSPLPIQTGYMDSQVKRETTVGRVLPHVEAKIIDPATGKIVPRGAPGELLVRGYLTMLGYWADPESTRKTIDSAGWLHSGDLAKMDEDGYMNIVGRSKDMVIRGGENIYPAEIEEFLGVHPKIKDAYVVGVPDEKYGEELLAWVRAKPGEVLCPDELRDFFKSRLCHFKIPRYWRVCEQVPQTASGKVQKFLLRELAIRELGLEQIARIQTS